MYCVDWQVLNSVEDAADVKAADRVQAELAALSNFVSSHSELKKLPPSRRHIHTASPNSGLSQVNDLPQELYRFYSLHLNESAAVV